MTTAVLASAAIGVSVASALVDADEPTPPDSLAAVPGSAHVDQTAPDPDGGPDWAVRLFDGATGRDCLALGRLDGDRFGRVDPDGTFVELTASGGGTCGQLGIEPALVGIGRYPAGPGRPARTVLYGRVRDDVVSIEVTPSGAPQTEVEPGDGGGFVFPRAGLLEPAALPVRITLDGGGEVTYDWR